MLFLQDILRYAVGDVIAPLNTNATTPPNIARLLLVLTRQVRVWQCLKDLWPFEWPKRNNKLGLSVAAPCRFCSAAD
jgi:hypothetical protein